MDTHISSYPDLEPNPAGISARLPGEAHEVSASSADLDVAERLPSSAPKPARRRRGVLLAGVAIVAVVVAGGAFLVSPYNTVYPLPHLQASVNRATTNATHYAKSALRPVLAPSASLAKVSGPACAAAGSRCLHAQTPRSGGRGAAVPTSRSVEPR